MSKPDAMNTASATGPADSGARLAIRSARPSGDADEATMRRLARRWALLLMAASSLVTIALLTAAWLVLR